MSKLTDKQERFVQEYLIDLNATQAAIRAGYSEKTAAEIGRQNLIKLEIAERIAELQNEIRTRNNITIDDLVQDLLKIKNASVSQLKNGWLTFKEWDDVPEEIKYAISEISENKKTGEVKVKLESKLDAIDKLGKHLGLYEKDNDQKKPLVNLNFSKAPECEPLKDDE